MFNRWQCYRRLSTRSTAKRLRIAYFGSDEFSVVPLHMLLNYKKLNENFIEDISIISRSIKPKGRKLKNLEDLPVGKFATDNNLRVMRADSSKEIEQLVEQENFNLAIAVSYGKLIPENFLKSVEYGGLNVHPSLLPRYAGPSPIQYSLLKDDEYTGVTVQTLHPTKFDRGDILSQSEHIIIENEDNFSSLRKKLGTEGGKLLIDVIDNELFINPSSNAILPSYEPSKAPKLGKNDMKIDWNTMNSRKIKRIFDALGAGFTFIDTKIFKKGKYIFSTQKIVLRNIKVEEAYRSELSIAGQFEYCSRINRIVIKTIDSFISVGELTSQCCPTETASDFNNNIHKRIGDAHKQFK